MKKLVYNSITELCVGVSQFLFDILIDKPQVNIALSGGSTPKALFDFWAENLKGIIPWEKINFFWGDERCVPPDDEMSNFGMAKKHFLDKMSIPNNQIFRIRGEANPEEEARRYGNMIPQHFDLVILGLGEDGHTASIFPSQIELFDSHSNCVVTTHPETGMKRISVTGRIINQSDYVAFLVTGKNKEEKVREILTNRRQFIDKYPAARVDPISENLFWFVSF